MTQGSDAVYLGFVEKAHGLRGGFVARLFSARGEPGLPAGTRLELPGTGTLTVRRSSPRDGSTVLVTTAEIRTREEAESLCGTDILVDRETAGRLTFLPLYRILGLVIRSGGRSLAVAGIEPLPGNPLLIVEDPGGKRFQVPLAMLPAIPADGAPVDQELPAGLEDL